MRSDTELLAFDPFGDRDEIKNRSAKIVPTRSAHACAVGRLLGALHLIPAGGRAVRESFRNGDFQTRHYCLDCLNTYMDRFPNDDLDALLTVDQCAAIRGVSRRTIIAWLEKGRIAGAKRFGRAWSIPRASIDSLQIAPDPRFDPRRKKIAV